MAIKKKEIAAGVRVKLNENFVEKCMGDAYLKDETVLYLREQHLYNDTKGEYVLVEGGSGTTSGYVYLDELDLEFPYGEKVRYPLKSELV